MYRVAHSVLEHRLGATSVATFITKRAALVRSQRLGSRLWWSAAMEGTVGRRGCKPWVAIGASCLRCWIWTSENPQKAKFAQYLRQVLRSLVCLA